MSLPSRVKNRCGLIETSTRASPGAARAEAGPALAAQPKYLAFLDAGRNLHVEGAALGQVEPHGVAVDGVEEIDRQAIADVGPARIGTRMGLLAQEFGENVVGFGEVGEA